MNKKHRVSKSILALALAAAMALTGCDTTDDNPDGDPGVTTTVPQVTTTLAS